MAEINDTQRDAIITAIRAGRMIEAIKLYREATGIGLKESKEFVEALQDRLHEENPEKFPARASGCSTATVLVVVGVAIGTLLF